jgi:hypothetical protein
MIPSLATIIMNAPKIVSIVETLFHHKPKSGSQKMALAKQLCTLGLKAAELLPANADVHKLEDLAQQILEGAVTDANTSGEFTHGTPPAK